MKKYILIALMLTFFGLACSKRQQVTYPVKQSLKSLLATEKAFSDMSAEKGMKAAFLAHLADDGLLFRPDPVYGKEVYTKSPENEAALTWIPAIADVSTAGDMGWTAGPWTLRMKNRPEAPPLYGQYVSIWRRVDSTWQLAADLGIMYGKAITVDSTATPAYHRPAGQVVLPAEELAKVRQSLFAIDSAFGHPGDSVSMVEAYARVMANDVYLLLNGKPPIVGRAAVMAQMSKAPLHMVGGPDTAIVAQSGDMGYTYGKIEVSAPDAIQSIDYTYVRIWRRPVGEDWQLALDIAIPRPPKKVK